MGIEPRKELVCVPLCQQPSANQVHGVINMQTMICVMNESSSYINLHTYVLPAEQFLSSV